MLVVKSLTLLRVSLQSPVSAKKEKKVSCMFIPDGHVSVSARIDRKGFCDGEILEHGNFPAFTSTCL